MYLTLGFCANAARLLPTNNTAVTARSVTDVQRTCLLKNNSVRLWPPSVKSECGRLHVRLVTDHQEA
ncbi:MAG: hypothetical protein ACJ79J_05515, partial [Gemmatimonadaceae bacterium]